MAIQVPGSASAAPANTSQQRQGTAASSSAPAAPPSPAPQQPSFKRSRKEPQQQRSTAVHPSREPAGGGAFSATPQSPETWDGEVDFDIPAAKSPAASSMPSASTPQVINPPHRQGAAVRGEGYQQHAGSSAARMHAGLHAAGQNGNGFAYSGMAQRSGAHAANGHARDPLAQREGSRFLGASEEGPAASDQKMATEQKLRAAQAELEALKASIAGRQAKLAREEVLLMKLCALSQTCVQVVTSSQHLLLHLVPRLSRFAIVHDEHHGWSIHCERLLIGELHCSRRTCLEKFAIPCHGVERKGGTQDIVSLQREAQARAEFERRQREDLAKRRSRLEAGFAEVSSPQAHLAPCQEQQRRRRRLCILSRKNPV
jgi:hypothetical protein